MQVEGRRDTWSKMHGSGGRATVLHAALCKSTNLAHLQYMYIIRSPDLVPFWLQDLLDWKRNIFVFDRNGVVAGGWSLGPVTRGTSRMLTVAHLDHLSEQRSHARQSSRRGVGSIRIGIWVSI